MKRSPLTLPVAVLALAVLGGAPSASAAKQVRLNTGENESPQFMTAGLSFGVFSHTDSNLKGVYGSKPRFQPRLTVGLVPWSKIVRLEINFGVGYLQRPGSQVFSAGSGAGAASADRIWLTLVPMDLYFTVGIDIFDEQPVVPYGGLGLAVVAWREHGDNGVEYGGLKFGGQVVWGGAFLLDGIEPVRAHRVDAIAGINDAYLTVEGRFSKVETSFKEGVMSTEGLAVGGWSLLIGIKLAI